MDFDFRAALAWVGALPLSEFISALIGALVGGLLTMKATRIAHKLESERLIKEQKTVLNNTLCLLKEELSTAWEIYQLEYADDLLKLDDRTPYLESFPIGTNTFPIYDSAPSCLANAPPEITREIIRLYMRIKGLISMIEINNADVVLACEYGRSETEKLRATLSTKISEPTKEFFELLNSSYSTSVKRQAFLLGMGSNTEELKNLTKEIASNLESVITKIDDHISKN
ncbi:hypothetical protein [Pseudomonas fluorescens]|uniref:hypothetical protein n=1 Tax=Pseudomonas fluorescens TaxID=294 RepID=UPI001249815C|nr:hypothetical protein [Pseudomonas fluorescens]CAG8864025.1 hypothetical protein PS861_00142 [Pseudomonas fluorescens]